MARAKLSLPLTDPVYQCEIPVRITDLNYGGHLGNQVILEFCHEARMQYLQKIGQSELQFLGLGLIMSDSVVVYKSESFWQDKLTISIHIEETHNRGFDLFYHIKTNDNKEVARVKTGMVFFDYDKKKIASAPEQTQDTLYS